MTKKWILYDKNDRQVTWPACIKNLSTVKNALGEELPTWIRQAFNKEGIFNEEKMIVPIRPISVLGQCSTAKYINCPNMPKHHIENARNYAREGYNRASYLDRIVSCNLMRSPNRVMFGFTLPTDSQART